MSDTVTNPVEGGHPHAIETRYAGCHFRSRLEARWAVFFDALGIPWEYEAEGYVGHSGLAYLPDFHLPTVNSGRGTYVEVKGSDTMLHRDAPKIAGAIEYQATPIADKGLVILGDVPRVDDPTTVVTHWELRWRKGVHAEPISWSWLGEGWSTMAPALVPASAFGDDDTEAIPLSASTEAMLWQIRISTGGKWSVPRWRGGEQVLAAYVAARSARFEHGQSGSVPAGRVQLGARARRA